ncbi:MAG: hypothetical protein H7318_13410 [Oligoflexus sp.]|nr:hypothetical protein [Oligoflexus sp.]
MAGIHKASGTTGRFFTLPFLRFVLLIPLLSAIVSSIVALFLLCLDLLNFASVNPSPAPCRRRDRLALQ